MAEFVQDNWIYLIVALVLAAVVIGWFLFKSRRTRVEFGSSGDEDGAPAQRNQSLIDAQSAVPFAPTRPVQAPAETSAAASTGGGDNLTRIKGVGPKLQQQLQEVGVTSFAQIAAWDEAEIDRVDAQLGRFQGRIRRDDWRTQAGFLATDDTAGYEAQFGKL